MTYTLIPSSSFLDYCGYRITAASSVQTAFDITDQRKFDGSSDWGFNVGLMLNRQQDPSSLLSGNWASRQKALKDLNASGGLWKAYGADPKAYDKVEKDLRSKSLTVLTEKDSSYVIGPDPRMIWVTIKTADDFKKLFDKELLYSPSKSTAFWDGDLKLPDSWSGDVSGIWIDNSSNVPPASNLTPGISASLSQGSQSIGSTATAATSIFPQDLAKLYKFPLQAQNLRTGVLGLIEPGIGTYLEGDPEGNTFLGLLGTYLSAIGQSQLTGAGGVFVQGKEGQTRVSASAGGERSLDVGVAAAVNPNSLLALYNGSGDTPTGTANASVFTAAQSAIWDRVNNPAVTSNSYGDPQSMAPGSPFYAAYAQMFLDAALRNQTTVIALGDGGSGNETANGLTNVEFNVTQPYNLLVGGTSLSSLGAAASDSTLTTGVGSTPSLYSLALNHDPATLWQLLRSGLSQLPDQAKPDQWLLESVWNTYVVSGSTIGGLPNNPDYTGYLVNSTSSGGVDPTQSTPSYQLNFGLSPITSDPLQQIGRGAPDVAINAGGNTNFMVPYGDMKGLKPDGGTSAAAPLYASLLTQINHIFTDQGLPHLGYANDLLYTAAAVAPGAFNDVTLGNNVSSYIQPGPYTTTTGNNPPAPTTQQVQPTGFGYSAGPGYDLVSGLGSPNGTLLARALTAIAHYQWSADNQPAMLQSSSLGALNSSTAQTLLWQVSSSRSTAVTLGIGGNSSALSSGASATYGWSSQLAQQSLQKDFDSQLVRQFDGASQGSLVQTSVGALDSVAVSIGGTVAATPQLLLTNPYGLVDFVTGTAAVRGSRPVSVATTPGDSDNVQAVVRLRQNGMDTIGLFFYRVDDLTGQINGLMPGQSAYEQAAQSRRYAFSDGSRTLKGAGYGNYSTGLLNDVDSGDLIAFGLINQSYGQTYYGFSQANEIIQGSAVEHLWNYGFNTYGFEDTLGGGDHDFNDAVFQIDFSSASGNQYLV